MRDTKRIWFTWEIQRRNRSMAKVLNMPFYELISKRKGLLRYVELLYRTFVVIISVRPRVVFAQNPSIVLSLFVIILKPFFGYKVVIDEHNAGVFPAEGKSKVLTLISNYIMRQANLLLVTNDSLSIHCKRIGGIPFVMPDPLPLMAKACLDGVVTNDNRFRILFICTWAEDEPIEEVILAANRLDARQYQIRITGRPNLRYLENSQIPDSIKLLGYVSDEEYISEIFSVHAVIVLTNRENCLNCGAYESVSAGKPGILSDSAALKDYFSKGFIFTNNSQKDLVDKIHELKSNYDLLVGEVTVLAKELMERDRAVLKELETALDAM